MSKRPSATVNPDRMLRRRLLLSDGNEKESGFHKLLYDELILLIFSYLSYSDLCNVQRINSTWARLSLDNELWKHLYHKEFGRRRLRGSKGFSSLSMIRSDGRPVKPLPTRSNVEYFREYKDWKWMFRISCNWRTGRSLVEELSWSDVDAGDFPLHIAMAGGLIIAASPFLSTVPRLILQAGDETTNLAPMRPDVSRRITALALDQSQPAGSSYRLVVFYSTGSFSLFLVDPSDLRDSREIMTHTPSDRRLRSGTTIQAAYHHPLLITLTSRFDLTIYELQQSSETGARLQVRLRQTLTSFTSHLPTSLILSNPSIDSYRLILAYTVPIYPEHWTAGITEVVISSFAVQTTYSTTAFDMGTAWVPLTQELVESLNEQNVRKLTSVSSVSTDGRYVALASGSTNLIQLFRLSNKSRDPGIKLTFLRTLHGHISPVQSLVVSDGRCVSLTRDGSLWAWDVDRDSNVEVRTQIYSDLPISSQVIFDERRIIVALSDRIIIHRFDV